MSPRKKTNKKVGKLSSRKQERRNKREASSYWAFTFKRNFNAAAILLISVIGFLAYSNTFQAEMQFDDGIQIINKEQVKDLSHFTSLSDWTNINKRPLSYLSFALNYQFGGYRVAGYHIFNLLIHLINAILIFLLAKTIFVTISGKNINSKPDYNNIVALFAALLFVTHPIQTQGVTYIIQRMTSQSALFYLLAMLFYATGRMHHVSENKKKAFLFYSATCISAICSLLSKQIAVTIPFALLLYEFFFVRNNKGKRYTQYIFISLTVLFIGVFYVIISGLLPTETEDISRYKYLITQSRVIVKYFQLLILPIQQNVDYSFPLSESIWALKEILSIGFLLGLLGLAVVLTKKRPIISFGIFWIFLTLSVESSIIPIRDVIFEHRLYLPMFGFALIMTDLIFGIFRSRKTKPAVLVFGAIIIILGFLTYSRNKVWRTQYSLWLDIVEKSPDKTRPLFNLINLYSDDGRHLDAIRYAKKAVKLDPLDEHAYFVAGICNERAGNVDEAIMYYKSGIQIDTTSRQSMNNLGNIYLKRKDYNEAVKYFLMALDESKKQNAVLKNLVIAHFKLKDYNNTIRYAKKYILKVPDDMSVLSNLGDCYLYQKKTKQAIKVYNKMITLDPNRVSTNNNLGTCYYFDADYEKAAYYYTEALSIDPANKKAKQYLALTQKYLKK